MENISTTHLDCWVLDEVETDFITIWELVSVFHQRQPEISTSDILMQLKTSLGHLYALELLTFYQGIVFNGDEHVVEVDVTDDFIFEQSEDWKSLVVSQIKIHITPRGREVFLANCNSDAFNF